MLLPNVPEINMPTKLGAYARYLIYLIWKIYTHICATYAGFSLRFWRHSYCGWVEFEIHLSTLKVTHPHFEGAKQLDASTVSPNWPGVQGLLKGPVSFWVLDALKCNFLLFEGVLRRLWVKEMSLFVNLFLLKSPKVLKVTWVICFSRVMKFTKCN